MFTYSQYWKKNDMQKDFKKYTQKWRFEDVSVASLCRRDRNFGIYIWTTFSQVAKTQQVVHKSNRAIWKNVATRNCVLQVWLMTEPWEIQPTEYGEIRRDTERYRVSLRIQSKCGKIRTRKNSVFGHFSRSVCCFYHECAFDLLIWLIG